MLEALLDVATSRANDTFQPSSIRFGGHLDKHNVSVSLAAFADWALSHHCRRYATSIVNTTYCFADSKLQQAAFMRAVLPKPSWRLTSMLPGDIRRFARHRTFMYLLYDILLLRSSSLGNS
jgi:hypothetical protein